MEALGQNHRERNLAEVGPEETAPFDKELATQLAARDEAAFEECFRRYHRRIVAQAQTLLGDAARAEEVTQDVFIRLWNRPDRFDASRGTLVGFLLTDVRGRAIDLLRSDGRSCAREAAHGDPSRGSDADALDVVALERVTAMAVRNALTHLSPEAQASLGLAFFGGHTYAEVARLLELPEGTVKTRIRAALKLLRQSLERAQLVSG